MIVESRHALLPREYSVELSKNPETLLPQLSRDLAPFKPNSQQTAGVKHEYGYLFMERTGKNQ